LAFLISLAEMRLAQNMMTSFKKPVAIEDYRRPLTQFAGRTNS
jgi:hypothetical protein